MVNHISIVNKGNGKVTVYTKLSSSFINLDDTFKTPYFVSFGCIESTLIHNNGKLLIKFFFTCIRLLHLSNKCLSGFHDAGGACKKRDYLL